MNTKIYLVALLLVPLLAQANFIVSVVQVPDSPNGDFSAIIAGASELDPTPNPCLRMGPSCDLYFFTIPESWVPSGGLAGYTTQDIGYDTRYPAEWYPTLGEWWAAVRNKGRIGTDYLSAPWRDPCVVIAAGFRTGGILPWLKGYSMVSNCARGIVQAPTCTLTPNDIRIDLQTSEGKDITDGVPVPGVSVQCNQDASILIQTNTGEKIPLNGRSDVYALIDWGAGYGKPLSLDKVQANMPVAVPLRVKTNGLAEVGAGVISGSSVVNVSYQ